MKDAGGTTAFGWAVWHGHPAARDEARRHDEVELVFVERGSCEMEVGPATIGFDSGALAAFWALAPHRIARSDPAALLYRMTVPVPDLLQWHLPEEFTRALLDGKVVTEKDPTSRQMDRALFKKWLSDFADTSACRTTIVRLEIEARLRRLASSASLPGSAASHRSAGAPGSSELDHAMCMARYIAEHYTEPIHDDDIASAVKLNTQYAIRLFSKTFGVSMHKYLTKYRISRACRLLTTTNSKVIDVAMEAGFGSMTRFYETFTRDCGQSPQIYRLRN